MKRRWMQFPALAAVSIASIAAAAQEKPRITLDEFFNSVEIGAVRMAPAGDAILIATRRADWRNSRFRNDIWIAQLDGSQPRLLTQSGHESDPKWSPDGKWVAFVSDRPVSGEGAPTSSQPESTTPKPEKPVPSHPEQQQPLPNPQTSPGTPGQPPESPTSPGVFDTANAPGQQEKDADKEIPQLYVLSLGGGEPVQVTFGREGVHALAWAADSASLFVAARLPETEQQREEHTKQWADVKRYREDERGDVIQRISLSDAMARASQIPPAQSPTTKPEPQSTPGTRIATTAYKVSEMMVSPDGRTVAFSTDSLSSRVEDMASYEIYTVAATGGTPRQLTHDQAIERRLEFSPDGKHVLFTVGMGSVDGPYQEAQPRLFAVDVNTGAIERYAPDFPGAIENYAVLPDGGIVAGGRLGTNVGLYSEAQPSARLVAENGWKGTYGAIAIGRSSRRVAFVYSSLQHPTEVYVADDIASIDKARPVTSFNALFTKRALPEGRTYRWKSDDGTEVEGMLIYPPGKFGAKHLRMLTLIHGGPEDADGDAFGADWYDWAILAASHGWLVFRPNYRGSTGYGDKFELQIRPDIVSLPGRDILSGVDSLVREGIADPDRLTVGGYSYGGYMTNWLITQTNRFKAAVTGAGAVEHAANWGNDDLTYDDAWYLGGTPWQAENNYNKEAALWQIAKVKTPTHMVAGMADIRVSVLESYLMERAFQALGVPHTLLLFPGEGHSLSKNPWHGRIKVREELKWLEKYVPES